MLFQLDGTFLHEDSVVLLFALAASTNLYLVTLTKDDKETETEQTVNRILRDTGLFSAGLKEHRVLFCSTSKGKQAIVRHIEPSLYVDSDFESLLALKPFISDTVYIGTDAHKDDKIKTAVCLSQYLDANAFKSKAASPLSSSSSSSSSSASTENASNLHRRTHVGQEL